MSSTPTETLVHPTAIIDPTAQLDIGVTVEPYAIIEGNVEIGSGSVIGAHSRIGCGARLGREVIVHHAAAVSTTPQDLKFHGEETVLNVGDRTVIREYASLNRGTEALGRTDVGSDCLIMAYTHVAHDCIIGDHAILANAIQLGGHVTIGDWAILGGAVVVHQFTLIGAHCMIGGGFRVTQDVPPYIVVGGYPLRILSLNKIGLGRRDFSTEQIAALSRAFRILFRSGLNRSQGLQKLKDDGPHTPETEHLIEFFAKSTRGVLR